MMSHVVELPQALRQGTSDVTSRALALQGRVFQRGQQQPDDIETVAAVCKMNTITIYVHNYVAY